MTPRQLDLDAAFVAADLALVDVEANAAPTWLDVARGIVRAMPPGHEFTTDDVWVSLGDVRTHEPRAMGAVMRGLQRDGVIVNTRQYRPSERAECHARPIPVWRRT